MMRTLRNAIEVDTIYHIGDIHIRKTNEREQEYEKVFKRMFDKIEENKLIVCVGDIFHDGISPQSIMLAKKLFIRLCDLSDVIVFRGNHDQTSRTNPESIDYLQSVLYKLETKNRLYVLDNTGEYEYGNIVFGYTDVSDKEVCPIGNHTDKIKIGLWHGMIAGCKNDTGIDISVRARFSAKNFEGYDYVMLGDIHKRQEVSHNIAYCGSLIQQNYGEKLGEHGILKWNLKNGTKEFIEIENEYGFITINVDHNQVLTVVDKIPKNAYLRINYKETSEDIVRRVYDDISGKANIIKYDCNKEMPEFAFGETGRDIAEEINDEAILNQLQKYIEERENITTEEKTSMRCILIQTMKEVNRNQDVSKKTIKLKRLMFNNFNVFGTHNYVDYGEMKGIINICGKNGIGKSSVAIYALIYALYGPARETLSEHINNRCDEMSTLIEFEVNGMGYQIRRKIKLTGKKKDIKHNIKYVKLFRDNVDISSKDDAMTNKQIEDIIGSQEDFLDSCVMGQKMNTCFLDQKDIEKGKLIFTILKMDVYEEIQKKLKDELDVMNKSIKLRCEQIYDDPKDLKTIKTEKIMAEAEDIQKQLEELRKNEQYISRRYDEINNLKIEKEVRLRELSNTSIDKNTTEQKLKIDIEDCDKQLQEHLERDCLFKAELEKIEHRLEKFVGIEEKKLQFDNEKANKIKRFTDNNDKLYASLVNIEEGTEKYRDAKIIREEREELLKEKDVLDNIIHKLRESIDTYKANNKYARGHAEYIKLQEKLNIEKMRYENKIAQIDKLKSSIPSDTHTHMMFKLKKAHDNTKIGLNECTINKQKNVDMMIHLVNEIVFIIKRYSGEKKLPILKLYNDMILNNVDRIKILRENINIIESDIMLKNMQLNEMSIKYSEHKSELKRIELIESRINEENTEAIGIKRRLTKINRKLKSHDKYRIMLEGYNKNISEIEKRKIDIGRCVLQLDRLQEEHKKSINCVHKSIKNAKQIEMNEKIMKKINRNKICINRTNDEQLDCYAEYKELLDKKIELTQRYNENTINTKNIEFKLEKCRREYAEKCELIRQINEREKISVELESIVDEFMRISEELRRIRSAIILDDLKVHKLNIDLEHIKQCITDNDKIISRKETFGKIMKIIGGGFVDNLMTNKIIPSLCDNVNIILSSFVDFKILLEYSAKKIWVYKIDAFKNRSCASRLSGYETLMANIAFKMAFNDINRAYKTNFFIIDEGFSYCDDESTTNVQYLFDYIRKRYDFAIIVSHNERIKSFTDVDVPICVENGFSHVDMSGTCNDGNFERCKQLLID